MADTPQTFRSVEPLQQVEQPVSLNQRVDRNKDRPDRRNRPRRPINTHAEMEEEINQDIEGAESPGVPDSESAGDHIDFRA